MNNKEFEPIRIRIMQEAYELADRGDVEGYNAVKVMCNDVQNLLKREWVGLTDEEMRELEKQFEAERVRTSDEEYLVIYPAAYWQWQRAIEAKLKEKNNG